MAPDSHSNVMTSPDYAEVYSKFSSGLTFSDIPKSVVDVTTIDIYDTLACIYAGFTAAGTPEVRELVLDWGGKPEAVILGTNAKVPAPQAAWCNGMMAHARDYDDTHDRAVLHAAVSVIPAAIAATEIAGRPISGQEFYTGIIAGLEMICRLGVSTKIDIMQTGFLYTSLYGYFAATATVAKILGLSAEDTHNAMGLVLAHAAGSHQATRDSALTKRMQPGLAARGAIASVMMAKKGVRGARLVFDGADGVNRIYVKGAIDHDAVRADLGRVYQMEDLSFKPFPCCRFNHTAIAAALELRAQPGFDLGKVSEIRAYTNSQGFQAVCTPLDVRHAPKTVVNAQFSIPYNVACALLNGKVGLADFVPEALDRTDVLALTARVMPHVDAEFDAKWGRNICPTRVEAVIDNRVFSAQVDQPKGGPNNPMTSADLRAKLEDCLRFGGFDVDSATVFEEVVAGLLNSENVAADLSRLNAAVAKD
jgi:2-methylcitrate dehydratase PrpD